jgi:hypothetical protein
MILFIMYACLLGTALILTISLVETIIEKD